MLFFLLRLFCTWLYIFSKFVKRHEQKRYTLYKCSYIFHFVITFTIYLKPVRVRVYQNVFTYQLPKFFFHTFDQIKSVKITLINF